MEAEFSRKICFDDIYIIVPIHPKGKRPFDELARYVNKSITNAI